MSRFVVEPAVAIKWFIPEVHSSQAARLLDGGRELLAPGNFLTETLGIVTAKIRLEEISEEEGSAIADALGEVPLRIQPEKALRQPGMDLAIVLDVPFRHGMNLAAAIQEDCRLVTANRTLYDRVQDTPFARHVKWVGDLR